MLQVQERLPKAVLVLSRKAAQEALDNMTAARLEREISQEQQTKIEQRKAGGTQNEPLPLAVVQRPVSEKKPFTAEEADAPATSDAQIPGQVILADDEDPANAVMSLAQQLFDDADADHSGALDESELTELMKELWRKLGRPLKGENMMHLQADVQKAMSRFDTDQSGTLSFLEFVRMVTMAPWKQLFPQEVQDKLPHLVRLQASNRQEDDLAGTQASSATMAWDNGSGEPAAVVFLRFAKELFDEADGDSSGLLESDEVSDLAQQLLAKFNGGDLEDLVQKVNEASSQLQGAALSFTDFLGILSKPPWKKLLPNEVAAELPRLVMKEVEALASNEDMMKQLASPKFKWKESDGDMAIN